MSPPALIASPGRRLVFGGLLMWVMVAATVFTVTIPVIATFLIDDFGISRTELGSLGSVGALLAAVSSPFAGRLTDRIGGRNAALIVLTGATGAAVLFAVSPVFGAMFGGAVVAAISGAGGNPGTNKLIAAFLEPGRRGFITGLKQTGPQVGSFFAGLLAPWGATTFGWRSTMVVIGLLMVLSIPLAMRVVPPDRPRPADRRPSDGPLPAGIWWVAVYGSLLGFGGSATFLLPLFVEESLGESPRVAGVAAALLGGVAIAGRLQWARIAERKASPAPTLAILAVTSVVAMAFMLTSIDAGTGWMWVGTVVLGLSSSSWTSVGAIAVIAIAGSKAAGRASGIVWFGFLAGLGLGPPLYGFTVDETSSYAPMWWIALGSFALAAVVAVTWMRTQRRTPRTG
ncbi:MAG: MFS transporter [Acidimicrobiia bacterium]|nr:MFS transporter [Acidimicrobiia bacterium]